MSRPESRNSRAEISDKEAEYKAFERILCEGLVRNMRDALPNASLMGFTGEPIEPNAANTRAEFGEYVSVYDNQQAVIDKATVPNY